VKTPKNGLKIASGAIGYIQLQQRNSYWAKIRLI